jgi:hypothetical protein
MAPPSLVHLASTLRLIVQIRANVHIRTRAIGVTRVHNEWQAIDPQALFLPLRLHKQKRALGIHPAFTAGVAHRNVETVLGRLATDPKLRRGFLEDPLGTLKVLCDEGLELSAIEFEALASTDAASIRSFADAIDPRIRKAGT